jgi:hypothetical protein
LRKAYYHATAKVEVVDMDFADKDSVDRGFAGKDSEAEADFADTDFVVADSAEDYSADWVSATFSDQTDRKEEAES